MLVQGVTLQTFAGLKVTAMLPAPKPKTLPPPGFTFAPPLNGSIVIVTTLKVSWRHASRLLSEVRRSSVLILYVPLAVPPGTVPVAFGGPNKPSGWFGAKGAPLNRKS